MHNAKNLLPIEDKPDKGIFISSRVSFFHKKLLPILMMLFGKFNSFNLGQLLKKLFPKAWRLLAPVKSIDSRFGQFTKK